MALGRCQYMTCGSMLGSSFRARFRQGDTHVDREVLLCPTHERECAELRARFPEQLLMTTEGWVVSGVVIDSMGFLS